MTTTIRVDRVTELVSTNSNIHIRPITIRLTGSLLKPNTRMYPFFDGVRVDQHCTQTGKNKGDPLFTDASGKLTAIFELPSQTFTTGAKDVVLLDYPEYSSLSVVGSTAVRAKAIFTANGTLETFQTTETTVTITTIETVAPPTYDPLAQSFFTYGMIGGCFITSIDLYFQSKDDTLPAWIEVREMVNGYPGPKLVADYAISTVYPANINVSANSSVVTKFTFPRMIYLEENRDYCFVVRSNSNKYNIWTSKLSERSIENNTVVFDQPYMGSLFKSENNKTWTAEQTEDIKFVMHRAKFDTNVNANVNVNLHVGHVRIPSSSVQTLEDNNKFVASFRYKHGLTVGSKIDVSVDPLGTYNGVAGTLLNNNFTVSDILNEYSVAFQVPTASPTSSGPIESGGRVTTVIMTNNGSGYSSETLPVITLTGAGTGATAVPVVENGKIMSITITNGGTGYYGNVGVVITSGVGSGATAVASNYTEFRFITNRYYHTLKPLISSLLPSNTTAEATLSTTVGGFENGSVIPYTAGKTYDINLGSVNKFDENLMIASRLNETHLMGGNKSTVLNIALRSDRDNVSPVINLSNSRIIMRANSINNQENENTDITAASGSIAAISVTNGGTGYSVAPTVIIGGTGSGATATATISGGAVTAVTVDTPGSGYYGPVSVSFDGASTTSAVANAILTEYNSELAPGKGRAHSRYITKTQIIETPSTGVKVYSTAFSNADSSFEFYIKTSLSSSGVNHDEQEWVQIDCPIARNRSQSANDFFEYEFSKNNLPPFDVYTLKVVLRTNTPWAPPVLKDFRLIALA